MDEKVGFVDRLMECFNVHPEYIIGGFAVVGMIILIAAIYDSKSDKHNGRNPFWFGGKDDGTGGSFA